MDIRLARGEASVSEITAISSKSYVHRLMICAALYGGACIETNILSNDMRATVNAVSSLGADVGIISKDNGTFEIDVKRQLTADGRVCSIDCGESGSTARFILPVAPLFAKEAVITGSGRLPERPMGPLCDVLRSAGVSADRDTLPIKVSGTPTAGEYSIAGNVSSQYISGLLFMLSYLDGPSKLTVTGKFESAAYVDMTVDVLKKFGADVVFRDSAYYVNQSTASAADGSAAGSSVRPLQRCAAPTGHIRAEGDWSNAAYLMAIAALGCGIAYDSFSVNGLDNDSIQGDRAIVDIMRQFGIEVDIRKDSCTVKNRPQNGVDVDCSQIPDLVPALSVLAANAEGDSRFRNIERLRIKECDRVDAVSKMLSAIDVMVDIIQNGQGEDMIVHGKGTVASDLSDIIIDSRNDHRIAMAASALAFSCNAPVVIKDAMAVDKSFPGFYEVIRKMGIDSFTV